MNVELPPQGQGAEPHHVHSPLIKQIGHSSAIGSLKSAGAKVLLKRSSGCMKKRIYFATNGSGYIPLPASKTIMVQAHTFSTPAAGVAGFLDDDDEVGCCSRIPYIWSFVCYTEVR